MGRKKKIDAIKAVPLPESGTDIKDTWNTAELNEESKTKDTWNPAVLNEELKRFDSWNPAEINQYLNSKYNLEAVHDANVDDGVASFVTLESSTIQEINYSLDQEEGSSSQIILQSSTNPPAQNHDPYVYRQIPSAATGKTKELITKLIGASVVWNQLVNENDYSMPSGATVSGRNVKLSGSGIGALNFIFISIASQKLNLVSGHKYLIMGMTKYDGVQMLFYNGTDDQQIKAISSIDRPKNLIVNATISGASQFYLNKNATAGDVDVDVTPNLIDLTALFGNSAIADYVYSLEQNQSGSGIAWLQKYGFFTESYCAYSANTIQSVSVSGHKVVGFNQWDEQWELGGITDSTGQNSPATDRIRSKNYIPMLPNTTYYRKTPENIVVYFYDGNKNFISNSGGNKNNTFTSPENTAYFRFRTVPTYGTIYNNDICINISNSENGQYKPYTTTTESLDHTTLRGLFKLDANNNLYADGDIYNADGSGSVKYGFVEFDGSEDESWTMYAEGKFFIDEIASNSAKISETEYISNLYDFAGNGANSSSGITSDKHFYGQRSYGRFWVYDSSYTTLEAFKTAIASKPLQIQYPLVTPTTAVLTPFNPLSVIEQGGTEEFVDYGVQESDRDVSIPVAASEFYYENATVVEVPNPPETLTSATVSIDNEGIVTITDTSGEEPETYTTSITMPDTLLGDNYMVVTPGTITGVKYTRIQPKIRRTKK